MNNKIYAALLLVSSAVYAMDHEKARFLERMNHPDNKDAKVIYVPLKDDFFRLCLRRKDGSLEEINVVVPLDSKRFDIDPENIFNSQARFRGERLENNIRGPSNVKEDGTKTPSPEKTEQN